MDIVEARLPDEVDEIVDLFMTRTPQQDRAILRADLDRDTATRLRVHCARDADGSLVGAAVARTSLNVPVGSRLVLVCTRADGSGRGIGSRLLAAARADHDPQVTRLVGCVLDGDSVSLAVARHWGFEHKQTSVTSACTLRGAAPPGLPAGVTAETCDDLVLDDEESVEAMLRASQTNPEADLGLLLTLPGLRTSATSGQRPVAVLTRVEGRPAALSYAVADGDQMHVLYTGVDPDLRGRAIGRLTKQLLHAHAHDLGVRTALTDNGEGNAGIRHVNDQLGYRFHSAWHWMMRPLG